MADEARHGDGTDNPWPPNIKIVAKSAVKKVSVSDGSLGAKWNNNHVYPMLITPETIDPLLFDRVGGNLRPRGELINHLFRLYNTEVPLHVNLRNETEGDPIFVLFEKKNFKLNAPYSYARLKDFSNPLIKLYTFRDADGKEVDKSNVHVYWFATWPDIITKTNPPDTNDTRFMDEVQAPGNRHSNVLKETLTIKELKLMTHSACVSRETLNKFIIQEQDWKRYFGVHDKDRIGHLIDFLKLPLGAGQPKKFIPLFFAFYKKDAVEKGRAAYLKNAETAAAALLEQKRRKEQEHAEMVEMERSKKERGDAKSPNNTSKKKQKDAGSTKTEQSDYDKEIEDLENYINLRLNSGMRLEQNFIRIKNGTYITKNGKLPLFHTTAIRFLGDTKSCQWNNLLTVDRIVVEQSSLKISDNDLASLLKSVNVLMKIHGHPYCAAMNELCDTHDSRLDYLHRIYDAWSNVAMEKSVPSKYNCTIPENMQVDDPAADPVFEKPLAPDPTPSDGASYSGNVAALVDWQLIQMVEKMAAALFTVSVCIHFENDENDVHILVTGLCAPNKTLYHVLYTRDRGFVPLMMPLDKSIFSSVAIDDEGADVPWRDAPILQPDMDVSSDGTILFSSKPCYNAVSNQFICSNSERDNWTFTEKLLVEQFDDADIPEVSSDEDDDEDDQFTKIAKEFSKHRLGNLRAAAIRKKKNKKYYKWCEAVAKERRLYKTPDVWRTFHPPQPPLMDGCRFESEESFLKRLEQWRAHQGDLNMRLPWKPRQHEPSKQQLEQYQTQPMRVGNSVGPNVNLGMQRAWDGTTNTSATRCVHREPASSENRQTDDFVFEIGADAESSASGFLLVGERPVESDAEYEMRLAQHNKYSLIYFFVFTSLGNWPTYVWVENEEKPRAEQTKGTETAGRKLTKNIMYYRKTAIIMLVSVLETLNFDALQVKDAKEVVIRPGRSDQEANDQLNMYESFRDTIEELLVQSCLSTITEFDATDDSWKATDKPDPPKRFKTFFPSLEEEIVRLLYRDEWKSDDLPENIVERRNQWLQKEYDDSGEYDWKDLKKKVRREEDLFWSILIKEKVPEYRGPKYLQLKNKRVKEKNPFDMLELCDKNHDASVTNALQECLDTLKSANAARKKTALGLVQRVAPGQPTDPVRSARDKMYCAPLPKTYRVRDDHQTNGNTFFRCLVLEIPAMKAKYVRFGGNDNVTDTHQLDDAILQKICADIKIEIGKLKDDVKIGFFSRHLESELRKSKWDEAYIKKLTDQGVKKGALEHGPFRAKYLKIFETSCIDVGPYSSMRRFIEQYYIPIVLKSEVRICTYESIVTQGVTYSTEGQVVNIHVELKGEEPNRVPHYRCIYPSNDMGVMHKYEASEPSIPSSVEYSNGESYGTENPDPLKRPRSGEENISEKRRKEAWMGASMQARIIIVAALKSKNVVLTDADGFEGADAIYAKLSTET